MLYLSLGKSHEGSCQHIGFTPNGMTTNHPDLNHGNISCTSSGVFYGPISLLRLCTCGLVLSDAWVRGLWRSAELFVWGSWFRPRFDLQAMASRPPWYAWPLATTRSDWNSRAMYDVTGFWNQWSEMRIPSMFSTVGWLDSYLACRHRFSCAGILCLEDLWMLASCPITSNESWLPLVMHGRMLYGWWLW